MNEINKTNLSERTKFRISEIIRIEIFFHQEINQRKLCIQKLSKYVTVFDCIDNTLLVLSTTTGGASIISFTLFFFLTARIIKKLLSITRNKTKKHDKILILAKRKLNSIKTLVSQALMDMEISHKEFNAIIREKQKYEMMKENVRHFSEKQEKIVLFSVK